jgi:hypothetical protein
MVEPELAGQGRRRIWFLTGFAYLAVTTRGFRQTPRMMDFSESS